MMWYTCQEGRDTFFRKISSRYGWVSFFSWVRGGNLAVGAFLFQRNRYLEELRSLGMTREELMQLWEGEKK